MLTEDEVLQCENFLWYASALVEPDEIISLSEVEFTKQMENLYRVKLRGMDYMLEDPLYQGNCQMRKVGLESFRNEILTKLKSFNEEELQEIVNVFNYDDNSYLLYEILKQEKCSITTVKQIYWALQPIYFYEEVDNLKYIVDTVKYYSKDSLKLLMWIEKEVASRNFYKEVENHRLNELIDIRSNEEYQTKPYSLIPESLRVYL